MWKIKHIDIQNICTIKDISYSFEQGVTTLIFGNNLDNDSQKNNGSGKSALIEAIVFGLTGSPLRQIKNEELINNDEESACINIKLENTASQMVVDIERRIYRKKSPDIKITMYRNGQIVNDGSTVKSGVDEYNKYILDLIGLTKDEIYSSFILSKHRYQDFLSASDKDKKEIINKYSNGNLVDQSIEVVQRDKKPLQEQLCVTELELSNLEGRISAIEEQIENEIQNSHTKQQTRKQRILDATESIIKQNKTIKLYEDQIITYKSHQKNLNEVSNELNDLDEKLEGKTTEEILNEFNIILAKTNLLSYDTAQFNKKKIELSDQIKQVEAKYEMLEQTLLHISDNLIPLQQTVKEYKIIYNEKKTNFNIFLSSFEENKNKYNHLKNKLNENIKITNQTIRSNNSIISDLEAQISGSIECPHCKKHFILGNKDFDIEKTKSTIEKYLVDNKNLNLDLLEFNKEVDQIEKEINELNELKSKKSFYLEDQEKKIKLAEKDLYLKEEEIQNIKRKQSQTENIINNLKEKQAYLINNLFDEIFNEITRNFNKLSNSIKSTTESISNLNGIIDAKKELIKQLEHENEEVIISSLQNSLKEYKEKRSVVYRKKNDLEDQIKSLDIQEARFIAFKTYLANSKVNVLNDITNNFLDQIGSDLKVKFDGYTLLKSGKIRDKISVSLLRDGVDVGNFAKFSEGEKARIQLATILAMNTLTNNNAEGDKGLDLLILDEILAAIDEEGLICILKSLNKLKITALVISHGKTSESYPHKLIITKQNGISTLNG